MSLPMQNKMTVIKRASITVHPESLMEAMSGECAVLKIGDEDLLVAWAIEFFQVKPFDSNDWMGFAGAMNLPSGKSPYIGYTDDESVVIVAGHEEEETVPWQTPDYNKRYEVFEDWKSDAELCGFNVEFWGQSSAHSHDEDGGVTGTWLAKFDCPNFVAPHGWFSA